MENQKILIAEDDVFISEMYNTKMSEEGFAVLTANDGQEALDVIKKEKPAVILLDILMPKIDGWEVLKKITSDNNLKSKSVVIMLTNLGDEANVKKAEKLGADDYLIKSLHTPEEVVDKIKNLLDNKFKK